MPADLTRALEMLDKIAPNRPRRSPVAEFDAQVDQALAPTMAAAPSTPASSPDAAVDRALSTPSGSYADFKAGRGGFDSVMPGGPAGGGADAAPSGPRGPGFTMATPSNVASLFSSNAPGGRVGQTLSMIASLLGLPTVVGPLLNLTARGIGAAMNTAEMEHDTLNLEDAVPMTVDQALGLMGLPSATGPNSGGLSDLEMASLGITTPAMAAMNAAAPFGQGPRGGGDDPSGPNGPNGPNGPAPNGVDVNDGVTASDGGQSSSDSGEGDAGDSGTWHTGGTIKRTGRANVQRGEEVIRASEAGKVRGALKDINRPGVSPLERRVAEFERRHGDKRI